MTTTLTYLDAYCERAGDPAFWAEPLNAFTNLFFIAAAVMATRALMRLPSASVRSRLDLWLLVAALFSIGIGSFLWHVHPTGSTVLLDVIPITLFIHIYLVASMRRLLHLSWPRVGTWWALYLAASIVAQMILPPDFLNGTVMYLPTYFTLGLLTYAVQKKNKNQGRIFMQMLLLWSLSLVLRTVDHAVCGTLSVGTHFLWHTLNAVMLYCLLMVLVRAPRQLR